MEILKKCFIVLFVLFFCGFCLIESKNQIQVDPTSVINEFFPDSVKLVEEDGEDAIEFCPDNTCELFVAKKEVSLESLKDFVYLYVYCVSDYRVLAEWRKQDKSAEIAGMILSKKKYEICGGKAIEEKIHCVLEYLAAGDKITLFDIRYDENHRSKEKKELHEAIKSIRSEQ